MAFDVISPVQLGQAAIAVLGTTLYTTPANTRSFVKSMTLCNTTSGAITFNFHLIPSGGTAGTDNALFYGSSIAPNTTIQWDGVQIMNDGDSLYLSADVVGLTITVSGAEAV